jgi:hypothetical protein
MIREGEAYVGRRNGLGDKRRCRGEVGGYTGADPDRGLNTGSSSGLGLGLAGLEEVKE